MCRRSQRWRNGAWLRYEITASAGFDSIRGDSYAPTILISVLSAMTLAQKEIVGPVAPRNLLRRG